MDKIILKKWLKSGVMEEKHLTKTEIGTPQGGIISPVLMNMTLDGIEQILTESFGKKGSKTRKGSKVHLIRYADDFLITGKSPEILRTKVMPKVSEFLKERGLALHPAKTKITNIEEGVNFLGHNIRKYKGKLIIKPSKTSVKSIMRKCKSVIQSNLSSTQEDLIERLNPIITGWANYHKWNSARKPLKR